MPEQRSERQSEHDSEHPTEQVREHAEQPTVVVGVDGSDQSRGALRWAAEHAARTGARLRVVHAVVLPTMGGLAWRSDALLQADRLVRALEDDGHLQVGRARGEAERRHPDLVVETAVVNGDPRSVLLAEAESAALVVVGSRGRGPVAGLLLGSVSGALARHTACPTVVHRDPAPGAHGVLTVADPTARQVARDWAALHATEVVEATSTDVDALVAAARDRELVVVVRRAHHRTPAPFDHAISVAEHAPCPVVVLPAAVVLATAGVPQA